MVVTENLQFSEVKCGGDAEEALILLTKAAASLLIDLPSVTLLSCSVFFPHFFLLTTPFPLHFLLSHSLLSIPFAPSGRVTGIWPAFTSVKQVAKV